MIIVSEISQNLMLSKVQTIILSISAKQKYYGCPLSGQYLE